MNKTTRLFSILFMALFSFSIFIHTDAISKPTQEISLQHFYDDNHITPLSDDIRWRYKIDNGKKYKRLYNYTTDEWIGDWILVG